MLHLLTVQYLHFGLTPGPSCQSFWGCSEWTSWCFQLAEVTEKKLYVPRWMHHRGDWKLEQVTCLSPASFLAFLRVFGLFLYFLYYGIGRNAKHLQEPYCFTCTCVLEAFPLFPFCLQGLYPDHGKQLKKFNAFCSNLFRLSIEWLSLFFSLRPLT